MVTQINDRMRGWSGRRTGSRCTPTRGTFRSATSVPTLPQRSSQGGGRPDLAGSALLQVRAATLLIVGGNDVQVIELNRVALTVLRCEKELVIVPGATHLFEEPGTLDKVASLAREWFQHHLISEGPRMARARS